MSTRSRFIGSLTLAAPVILTLLMAPPAAGHSALQSTDPPADQLTTAAITQLTLTFAQPIDILDNSVGVTDPDGTPIPIAGLERQSDGITVTVDLGGHLPSGTHTVMWRVIGSDGHPIEGAYRILIDVPAPTPAETPPVPATEGEADGLPSPTPEPALSEDSPSADPTPAATMATASPTPAPPVPGPADTAAGVDRSEVLVPAGGIELADVIETAARWATFLGIMLTIGVIVFGIAVHPDSPADQTVLTRLLTVGSLTVIVGSLVQLGAHVAVISGDGMSGVSNKSAWDLVAGRGIFTGTLLRALAGAGAIAASRALPQWSHARFQGLGVALAAVVLLMSFQYTGHTATSQPTAVVRVANAVHILAAAVWTGGVAALAAVMATRSRTGDQSPLMLARFSVAATGAVVLVGIAGTALAAIELQSLEPLFTTAYGRVLLGKLAIVAAIGAVGAFNHTRLIPSIIEGDAASVARMQRTMRIELALFPVALILTAILVRLSP